MLTLVLLFLGAVYFDHHSGWFNANVYQPYASAEELDAYQPKSGAAGDAARRAKRTYEHVCGVVPRHRRHGQTQSSAAVGRFGMGQHKGICSAWRTSR